MITKYKKIYIILPLLPLLFFTGCNSIFSDLSECEPFGNDDASSKLYLRVYLGVLGSNNGTSLRAQGDAPSINKDADDGEDLVVMDHLKIYAVNRSTGNVFANAAPAQEDKDKTTDQATVRLDDGAGRYDLYFLVYDSQYAPEGFKTRTPAKAQLENLSDYNFQASQVYHSNGDNSIKSRNGLFMSRVYKDILITASMLGTQIEPGVWYPFQPEYDGNIFAPVSTRQQPKLIERLKNEWYKQRTAFLIRSHARFSVTIIGDGQDDIGSLTMENVNANYTMAEAPDRQYETISLPLGPSIKIEKTDAKPEMRYYSPVYVPETLASSVGKAKWDEETDAPAKGNGITAEPVYMSIKMKSGSEFKIPIADVPLPYPPGSGYMKEARNAVGKYDVPRNTAYHFVISLDKEGIFIQPLVWEWYEGEELDPIYVIPPKADV